MARLVCERYVSDIRQEGLSVHLVGCFLLCVFCILASMDKLVCVCVCVCVCVSWYACVSDLEGFYGTSVTLAASAQHHSEWALVGRYVGGKYTETHFYRTECDPNKGLESSLEQQQHRYIVSTLSLNKDMFMRFLRNTVEDKKWIRKMILCLCLDT